MKTFVPLKKNLLASLLLIAFHSAFASDHLVFQNPSLVSGDALQLNAVYRFDNVKYGATNLQTGSSTRQFSLYMHGIQYPNQITLPVKLLDFTANFMKPNALLNGTPARNIISVIS